MRTAIEADDVREKAAVGGTARIFFYQVKDICTRQSLVRMMRRNAKVLDL